MSWFPAAAGGGASARASGGVFRAVWLLLVLVLHDLPLHAPLQQQQQEEEAPQPCVLHPDPFLAQ
jgi:hypothetical protein